MPLGCDCYPGCWGDHSKDWPEVEAAEFVIAEAYRWCFKNATYGGYVNMSTTLRIESKEEFEKCLDFIRRYGHDFQILR